MGTVHYRETQQSIILAHLTSIHNKMKLFIFFVLVGAVFAEDTTAMEETAEEGRTFLTPLLGLLPPLGTLVNLGTQFVILIALIGFVTGLKGVVDFESLFKKEDIADTYYRRGDYGPVAYQSGNFAPNSAYNIASSVNQAIENYSK